jgi:hypothetical protein
VNQQLLKNVNRFRFLGVNMIGHKTLRQISAVKKGNLSKKSKTVASQEIVKVKVMKKYVLSQYLSDTMQFL